MVARTHEILRLFSRSATHSIADGWLVADAAFPAKMFPANGRGRLELHGAMISIECRR